MGKMTVFHSYVIINQKSWDQKHWLLLLFRLVGLDFEEFK